MICRSCLRAFARPLRAELNSSILITPRLFSTATPRLYASPVSNQTTSQPSPRQNIASSFHRHSVAAYSTSTSTASTSTASETQPKHGGSSSAAKASTLVLSSIPAGTPLKGVNFLKNKTDPVAMEDSEYPPWLWEILKTQEQAAEKGKEGDLFSKSKKQRRLAAKRLRKEQAAHPELLARKVPIYEQTIDLPAGDGSVEGSVKAEAVREELQKAMRVKRRATIKEANFLKAMG